MNSEQYAAAFEENFKQYKQEPIALYGLGKNTADILENVKGYSFCVVANEHIGEEFHGYIVKDISEAVKGCNVLIITAINRSIKAIWGRISHQCPDGMLILDMGGRNLRTRGTYDIREYLEKLIENDADKRVAALLSERMRCNDAGRLLLESFYDLGYLLFAPFVILMSEKIQQLARQENAIFLLSARDCFIFHSLLEKIFPQWEIQQKYLYVSRSALSVAQINSTEDIIGILEDTCRVTRGDLVAILQERLGIILEDERLKSYRGNKDEIAFECRELCHRAVLNQREQIKRNACQVRENYCRYVDNLEIPKDRKIYFVDLVTKGSNHQAFRKVTGIDCSLLCLAYRDEVGENIDGDVCSIYEYASRFSSRNLLRYYEMLEIAFSSSEGQLCGIDEQLQPQFSVGTNYAIEPITQMQQGIVDAVRAYFTGNTRRAEELSVRFVDGVLGLLDGYSDKVVALNTGFEYADDFAGHTRINMWDLLVW